MLITPLFAAVFALMFLILSLDVVLRKKKTNTDSGVGEDPEMEKAIRIHLDFSEYVPFSLLLMWLVEVVTGAQTIVIVLGSVLLIGRVFHVSGMKSEREHDKFYQIGVTATFLVILVCSLLLLRSYLPVVTG